MTKKQMLIRMTMASAAIAVLAFSAYVGAGTGNLSNAVPGTTILASDFNKITGALKGDLVPRNTSGIATTSAGSLGTSSFKWLRAQIESGYWSAGDVKMHHNYGGAAPIGQGWMLADGRIINETNYDIEHGAGSWDIYVVSSPLDGRYLPDMQNRYPSGGSSVGDGVTPIATIGLSGNTFNNSHTHVTPSHNHRWLSVLLGGQGQTYDSTGSTDPFIGIAGGTTTNLSINNGAGSGLIVRTSSMTPGTQGYAYTDNVAPGVTNPSQSNSQTIRPDSIQYSYYVRVF